jgi:hypothetical protein
MTRITLKIHFIDSLLQKSHRRAKPTELRIVLRSLQIPTLLIDTLKFKVVECMHRVKYQWNGIFPENKKINQPLII